MKKIVTFLIFVILMTTSTIIYANLSTKTKTTRENLLEDAIKQEAPNQNFINMYYFDVNLNGFEELYTFGDFPFYNDKGQVSPLGKTILTILTRDVRQWVSEPRVYVKENFAFIHAVKLDGLNILYTLKKENDQWKVLKREEKKLPTIGSEIILEKAFLRAIGKEILGATKTYYGEERLFDSQRITDIIWNENEDEYDITIQIVTYKGALMPPYGLDTITLRIPGLEVKRYEHKDVSDIGNIPLKK